jgi:hypothetical protein
LKFHRQAGSLGGCRTKFGRPAKGNDKGKVENLVGYTRRNFMVPIPHAASWEALNEQFVRDAMARRAQRLRGHTETIGERFERDRAVLLPLPAACFEACDKKTVRVSSISLVRYRTNDYSVPTQFGHRQVLVKAYVHRIVIVCGSEVIAEHALWIRPRRSQAGSYPSASPICAVCLWRDSTSTLLASTSRCCDCLRPLLWKK